MDKDNRKILRRTEHLINQAVRKHKLIENNDHIVIGLSGGIDSMILLHTLAMRRRYYTEQYQLTAVHVQLTNISYQANKKHLEQFCHQYDVPLIWHEEKADINPQKVRKNPCFICSWNRRRILFQLTEKLGANKLALGHHRDDALETLLMNMIYHGSISSLPARLKMFNGNLILIRPLIYVGKEMLAAYAWINDINPQVKPCPFANRTNRRQSIAHLLTEMEKIHPAARNNLFRAMSHIYTEYLPEGEKDVCK